MIFFESFHPWNIETDLDEFREAFKQLNNDSPNAISENDISDVLAFLKQSCTKSELKKILDDVISNPTAQSVDLEALIDSVAAKTKITVKSEDIIEIFKYFDENNDGTIATKQFEHICEGIFPKAQSLKTAELKNIIKQADVDGRIPYELMVDIMIRYDISQNNVASL